MKLYNIFFLVCLGNILPMHSQQRLDSIKKDFLSDCSFKRGRYNHIVCSAFARFDQLLCSQVTPSGIVDSLEIQKLFQESVGVEQTTSAQLIIIAQLYDLFLTKLIQQIHLQMQQIVDAKQYWMKVSLENPVALLDSMWAQQAHLLGVCLHGKHRLQKINEIADIQLGLQEAVMPIYSFACIQEPQNILEFFQKIKSLCVLTQSKIELTNKVLKTHGVPPHIKRHCYAYSSLAATVIVGGILWYYNQNNVAEHQEKALRATHGFLQDVLLTPARGLKRALWDRPELDLKKFDLQNAPSTIWGCYTPERTVKYTLQTILFNMNKGVELLDEIIKGQRINYYLSAIIPVVAGSYAIYRNGRYYYNHESYFKPMRMVLREVDIVCNKLSGKTDLLSFADVGNLYFLVMQLNLYMKCLCDYEQVMMKYDMEELVSFDFTISQKQKVVERMYRTYAFLRAK